MSKQIKIKIEDVPEFLKSSELCQSVSVPEQYFIKTIEIKSPEDWHKVLNILNYWGTKRIPKEVWDYVVENPKLYSQLYNEKKRIFSNNTFDNRFYHALELICRCKGGGATFLKNVINTFNTLVIEYLLDLGIYVPINELIEKAREVGQTEYISELKSRYSSHPIFNVTLNQHDTSAVNERLLKGAISASDFDMIKKIISNGYNISDYQIITSAAYYGNVEIFKFLYENWRSGADIYYHQYIIQQVLQSGSFDMLKYLYEERNYSVGVALQRFSYVNTLEILKYLFSKGMKITSYNDLGNKSYEMLDYIFDENQKENVQIVHNRYLNTNVLNSIMYTKDAVDRLKYFQSKGFKILSELTNDDVKAETQEEKEKLSESINKNNRQNPCVNAISSNKLEFMEYLLTQGCELPDIAMEYAMSGTNMHNKYSLAILKYLNEKGCKWTSNVITQCKYYGKIDCLKYARENNCEEATDAYVTGQVDLADY